MRRTIKRVQDDQEVEKTLPKRVKFLPLLVISFVCWGVLGYIFFNVSPTIMMNSGGEGVYLPVLLIHFVAQFLFWTFLFLHSRRGFFLAVMMNGLLFFRLQGLLTIESLIVLVFPFILFELLFTLADHQ